MADQISTTAQGSYMELTKEISIALARSEAHAKATHERFNVFSTLLKESDEVRLHTRFLHCLLNPDGTHDCGTLFLDLFFDMLKSPEGLDHGGNKVDFKGLARSTNWSVDKEASRNGHGQIDLLLERPGFGIAIENKIYASEQPEQLIRYGNYLNRRHCGNYVLIYLTLDGKQAFTAGDHHYYRISYKEHVLRWLNDCLRATYNIVPVNQVIIQYRAVVRRLTHCNLENEFMNPVLDFVRRNPDILLYQEIISKAVDDVRLEVLDKFAGGIMEELKSYAEVRPNGRFSSSGVLWITPLASSGLPSFNIWLEVWGISLLLGMKVPQGFKNLDTETQRLLNEMSRIMNEENDKDPSYVPYTCNVAWPTGWDVPVYPLNDDVIAGWLKGGLASEIGRVAEAIRKHIRLLERAYTNASKQLGEPADLSGDSHITATP